MAEAKKSDAWSGMAVLLIMLAIAAGLWTLFVVPLADATGWAGLHRIGFCEAYFMLCFVRLVREALFA